MNASPVPAGPYQVPPPPVAPRRPHRLRLHGKERIDYWYWLRDRDNPEVLAYLEAESSYTDAILARTGELQEQLFDAIRSRVVETDAAAPARHGTWWYYQRTVEGLQYPLLCRLEDPEGTMDAAAVASAARQGTPPGEEVVLDENLLATGDYLAVGVLDPDPDHRVLAYAFDRDGSERYSLRFRDLRSGEDLDDAIDGVYYGSAWSADGGTLFYVRPDEAMRPYQVWRHRLGSRRDTLVFEETDERFFVGLSLSRTRSRVVIHTSSSTTSEALWVDATDPESPPVAVLPREYGVEYDVEHDGDGWLVRTNRPGPQGQPHTNFALFRLPEGSHHPGGLEEVLGHRPDVTIEGVDAFAHYLVVWERHASDGLERLRVLSRTGGDHLVDQPDPVYTLFGDANPEWSSPTYRFGYTSLAVPARSVEYDPLSRQRRTVWAQLVHGYDPSAYRTERLWATSHDGVRVPVSVLAPRDTPIDGSNPCLLYGYGAYQANVDPSFSVSRINLVERGFVFAIAHVRGGGELGRSWYEHGRLEHKINTFYDFIAAAEHLCSAGWADRSRLIARGGSAGGLLVGAVTNMRPDLWRAVVAEVPFVDVVTTMCDPGLPLTVTEWDEWGDPLHDPAAFERMLSYSPYDNVPCPGAPGEDPPAANYPAIFATAGLNDPRVGFWEPAKWVAKLRFAGAGTPDRPVLLRTEMGAGHRGASGRYDAWHDEARVQAFVLWQAGLA